MSREETILPLPMPLISIIHPSRGRADMALQTAKKWMVSCDMPAFTIQYILSIDSDDLQKEKYIENWKQLDHFASGHNLVLIDNNKSAMQAINIGAKHAVGNILVVVSDDFDCPDGWDQFLYNGLKEQHDYLCKVNDGHQEWIVTLPIMDKEYYKRFGYVYHPDYQHLFCDTEMTAVAHMMGKIIKLEDQNFVFKHLHHSLQGVGIQKDAISEKNDATWKQGMSVFYPRKARKFDIPAELIQHELPTHIEEALQNVLVNNP